MTNIKYRLNNLKTRLNEIPNKKFLNKQTPKKSNFNKQLDIAIVCCHFNPYHFKKRLKNYKIFRKGIEKTGVKLLTVELAFGDDNFELSEFQNILQLRTPKENIMWQKERLLNIGIQKLIQEGYNKIAWLDADIVFENDNWVTDLSNLLDIYPICQGFGLIKEVDESGIVKKYHPSSVKYYYETGKISICEPKPGGIWAAQTEILKKFPLYDYTIIGGGDSHFLFGCYYIQKNDWIDQIKKEPFFKLLNNKSINHYLKWAEKWGSLIKGRVGYLNHTIELNYHGNFINRQYVKRHEILKKHNFNPETDIRLGKNLCWEWASNKPQLHKEVKEYFSSRKEDD